MISLFFLLLALAPVQESVSEADADQGLPRVLFLTHSAGYEHEVVKRPDPETLSLAEQAFREAADKRLDVVASQDCGLLEDLTAFDAVVFYTTGELPVSDETRDGLMDWVRDGGAFVGIHCATDTFYESPRYLEMVGGTFDGHPWHERVGVGVEDLSHPSMVGMGAGFHVTDEVYQFRSFRRHPVNVLLELDTGSVDASLGKRDDGDYALAWWRDYGRGRVFYTALGHRPEVWGQNLFLWHLMAGVEWAISGPDTPSRPPEGAKALMGFDVADHWRQRGGDEFAWELQQFGAVAIVPGSGDIVSNEAFGDALVHVEFQVPLEEEAEGQARGNSGVYVQGRYEVQVLDSFGIEQQLGDCGAIYGKHVPAVNACRRPERWQSYDIRFTAPRFDDAGAKTAAARMSVWHNGLLVHDDVEVDGPTLAGLAEDEVATGPLLLQDHGDLVRYRNVWVLPLSDPEQDVPR